MSEIQVTTVLEHPLCWGPRMSPLGVHVSCHANRWTQARCSGERSEQTGAWDFLAHQRCWEDALGGTWRQKDDRVEKGKLYIP